MTGSPEMNFVGILVTDPEVTGTPAGAPVVTFTVATTDRSDDSMTAHSTEDVGVTFLPCVISHHATARVAASLARGMRVMVAGVLRQRTWRSSQGDERYAYEVAVTEIGVSLIRATPGVGTLSSGSRPC